MTETKITELVVGSISLSVFLWMFPVASKVDAAVIEYYPSNFNLVISAGTLVFCIGIFGLIAVYCFGACLEKVALYLLKQRSWFK
jgi:peptidoglycan/LPS O-acetylase OafA/YrhL